MKYLFGFLSLCLWICILQSVAVAGMDAVKIVPRSGEPMIVRKFSVIGWSSGLGAVWNQQELKVPVSKIRSIRFLGAHPDDEYDLEVELTMKSGEQPVMRIRNSSCYGETQFGRLNIHLDEIAVLDLAPDPSRPLEAAPPPPAAPAQGANP